MPQMFLHARVLGIAACCAHPLIAASVPITNPSFESPVQPAGTYSSTVPNWAASGSSGVLHPNGTWGITSAPDGLQVGYINTGALSQTLSAGLQPYTVYTLSISIGGRTDAFHPGTNYSASIFAGATKLTAVTPVSPPVGGWTRLAATYTTGETVPPGNLKIEIARTGTATNYQLNFDFVQLDASPVAPAITGQPASVTVSAGGSATFTVTAIGGAPLSFQWRKNGAPITGATASTLTVGPVTSADAGAYSVVVSNSFSSATSSDAVMALALQTPASITLAPSSQTVAAGGTVSFSVTAAGTPAPVLRWQGSFDGGATWTNLTNTGTYSGTATSTLTVSGARVSMAGNQFRAVASNGAGSNAVSAPAVMSVSASRLVNLSVRGGAGTGDQTLIVGFVTSGLGAKSVLIRAVGPTLGQFGVPGTIADPQVSLFNPGGAPIAQNNDWGGEATLKSAFGQVGAFPLLDGTKDASLLANLQAGTNTAQVSGVGGTTGVVLAEAYDLDVGTPTARLVNLSVRNQVGTADNILIVGFVISGTNAETILIRGVGPTLTQFGVGGALANPSLKLLSGTAVLLENDDWGGTPQLTSAFASVGAFALPANSQDAALLVTLQPGSYTAQVSGVGNAVGVALIEVYEMPP